VQRRAERIATLDNDGTLWSEPFRMRRTRFILNMQHRADLEAADRDRAPVLARTTLN